MTDKKKEPEKMTAVTNSENEKSDVSDNQAEEKTPRLQPVRVTGAGCKSAKLQTGRLKWKDGEPLPEFEGGIDDEE